MPKPGDHVAYFYIPLEQPLVGVTGPFAMELSPDQWPSRLADVADSRLPETPLDVSLALTTSSPLTPMRADQLESAMEVGVQNWQQLSGHTPRLARLRGAVANWFLRRSGRTKVPSSVVEAAVTLPTGWTAQSNEGPNDVLTAALDSALLAVKLLLLQVYSAQPDTPRILPTPESLPSIIPFMVCQFNGEGEVSLRPTAAGNLSVLTNDLGREAMNKLYDPSAPPELAPVRNSFATYWSLRNDAGVLLELRGQYRSSLLLIAATAENMIDSIGQLLLWSDGVSVKDAAKLFGDRAGPLKRANEIIAPRIGGGWRSDAQSPIGDWVAQVIHPRNEAVHVGADVSREAAWQAWQALDALRLHVGGLLMRNQSKYPMAALAVSLFLNLSSSPNRYAPTAARLISESPPKPGGKIIDFERWQRELVAEVRGL